MHTRPYLLVLLVVYFLLNKEKLVWDPVATFIISITRVFLCYRPNKNKVTLMCYRPNNKVTSIVHIANNKPVSMCYMPNNKPVPMCYRPSNKPVFMCY